MKIFKSLPLLLVAAGLSASAADSPRVSRNLMVTVEKSLETSLLKLSSDNTLTLLGFPRGVYLDGYGVVLTAEVQLVNAPVSLMHPKLTKEEEEQMRKRKIERLPMLKSALKGALVNAAASLDPVGPDDQIVIAVILQRFPFEESWGLPVQVTVQGKKKQLIDAKAAGGANLDAVVHIKEN